MFGTDELYGPSTGCRDPLKKTSTKIPGNCERIFQNRENPKYCLKSRSAVAKFELAEHFTLMVD